MTARGPYKRGRKDQMTDGWKELVRQEMRSRGMSQAQLEESISAGRGQIARMLADSQNTSVWVAKVCEVLSIPPPGRESDDENMLLENFRRANPDAKRAILQHAAASAGVVLRKN